MRTSTKTKSTDAPSKKVTKAVSAKAAKLGKAAPSRTAVLVPLKEYQGPLLLKPTAHLELRKLITPEVVESIAAEVRTTVIDSVDIGMPLAVFLLEAIDCALTVQKYWTTPNADKYRSLSAYAYRLGESIGAEIVHLVDLVEIAGDGANVSTSEVDDLQLERARFVNREVRRFVEFDADDGVRNEKDDEVRALKDTHPTEPPSIAALAASLGAFARHGKKYLVSLSQTPDFNPALVEEAAMLCDALRARRKATSTPKDALESRDVYLHMLLTRVMKVRKVVRHAYRAFPEVVREATSAFHRERRRADRKVDPTEGDEPMPKPAPEGDPA